MGARTAIGAGTGDLSELRIVGIDYEKKRSGGAGEVTFRFSDPAENPITENEFRRQLAASQGKSTFLPRPTYATFPGQVPLPAGPMDVGEDEESE